MTNEPSCLSLLPYQLQQSLFVSHQCNTCDNFIKTTEYSTSLGHCKGDYRPYSDAPTRGPLVGGHPLSVFWCYSRKANIGTKGIFVGQMVGFGKGCPRHPFPSPFVVIVDLSVLFYKLSFRKHIIVKPINISKLVHRMQRQNLQISKP